jgi:hypothetical protein
MIVVIVACRFEPITDFIKNIHTAKEFSKGGRVLAIIYNDQQEKCSISEQDRVIIAKAIRYTDHVFLSVDTDQTVCKTIEMCCRFVFKPTHFMPSIMSHEEHEICGKNDIIIRL